MSPFYVPPGITLVGKTLPHRVFVISDIGGYYVAIDRNGTVLKQRERLEIGNNIASDKRHLYLPIAGYLEQVDKKTFEVIRRYKLPFKAWIATMHNGKAILSAAASETSEISLFDLNSDGTVSLFHTPAVRASYPRDAAIEGNLLAIAETFSHQVVVYDMDLKKVIRIQPVYYPNSVHFIDAQTVLISEEHTNRVTQWNIRTGDYHVVFGCKRLFNADRIFDYDTAIIMEKELIDRNDAFNDPPKSKCAESYAGIDTLYSPNGARKYGDGYLIADTDNHRVVYVKNGKIVSALYGFNNPVDAVFIE